MPSVQSRMLECVQGLMPHSKQDRGKWPRILSLIAEIPILVKEKNKMLIFYLTYIQFRTYINSVYSLFILVQQCTCMFSKLSVLLKSLPQLKYFIFGKICNVVVYNLNSYQTFQKQNTHVYDVDTFVHDIIVSKSIHSSKYVLSPVSS